MTATTPGTTTAADPEAFIQRWQDSGAAERANYQLFLSELCDLLGVPLPRLRAPGVVTHDAQRRHDAYRRHAPTASGAVWMETAMTTEAIVARKGTRELRKARGSMVPGYRLRTAGDRASVGTKACLNL